MTRQSRTTTFPQVLILTALYLFGGSGGGVDIPKTVKKCVDDEVRRDAAVAAAEAMVETRVQMAQFVLALRQDFNTVLQDEFTAADLEAVFAKAQEGIDDLRAAFLDARFKMRDEMTPEEWAKLRKKID